METFSSKKSNFRLLFSFLQLWYLYRFIENNRIYTDIYLSLYTLSQPSRKRLWDFINSQEIRFSNFTTKYFKQYPQYNTKLKIFSRTKTPRVIPTFKTQYSLSNWYRTGGTWLSFHHPTAPHVCVQVQVSPLAYIYKYQYTFVTNERHKNPHHPFWLLTRQRSSRLLCTSDNYLFLKGLLDFVKNRSQILRDWGRSSCESYLTYVNLG